MLAAAVLNAEAQQVVVAHLPEQLLVLARLLALVLEHLDHLAHVGTVRGEAAVSYLKPIQPGVGVLDAPQVLHAAYVVGHEKVEVWLRLHRQGCRQQEE